MSDTKFAMKDMTPSEAARFVRQIAETTASASQNWDNFEKIVESMILSAMEAARKWARENPTEGGDPR